ncbi:hypothetical protein Y032_0286g1423 [Ancylostoma ceylanicum]|uniref:Uncharacterized protein n=1 Tax=Ancylostoma ceylanicum TaxID=53326 RepID=A0A016S628_9BILA|nr:hypothetical protein Y032_0286g1423 [Ancylostoma ceylanicum]
MAILLFKTLFLLSIVFTVTSRGSRKNETSSEKTTLLPNITTTSEAPSEERSKETSSEERRSNETSPEKMTLSPNVTTTSEAPSEERSNETSSEETTLSPNVTTTSETPSCDGVNCGPGKACHMVANGCTTCTTPQCLFTICNTECHHCASNERCIMMTGWCPRVPCCPYPTCVPA